MSDVIVDVIMPHGEVLDRTAIPEDYLVRQVVDELLDVMRFPRYLDGQRVEYTLSRADRDEALGPNLSVLAAGITSGATLRLTPSVPLPGDVELAELPGSSQAGRVEQGSQLPVVARLTPARRSPVAGTPAPGRGIQWPASRVAAASPAPRPQRTSDRPRAHAQPRPPGRRHAWPIVASVGAIVLVAGIGSVAWQSMQQRSTDAVAAISRVNHFDMVSPGDVDAGLAIELDVLNAPSQLRVRVEDQVATVARVEAQGATTRLRVVARGPAIASALDATAVGAERDLHIQLVDAASSTVLAQSTSRLSRLSLQPFGGLAPTPTSELEPAPPVTETPDVSKADLVKLQRDLNDAVTARRNAERALADAQRAAQDALSQADAARATIARLEQERGAAVDRASSAERDASTARDQLRSAQEAASARPTAGAAPILNRAKTLASQAIAVARRIRGIL